MRRATDVAARLAVGKVLFSPLRLQGLELFDALGKKIPEELFHVSRLAWDLLRIRLRIGVYRRTLNRAAARRGRFVGFVVNPLLGNFGLWGNAVAHRRCIQILVAYWSRHSVCAR